MAVSINLHDALLRLRGSQFERTLWIDALCINQDGGEDKNQQIGLLPMIYGQENCVVVWLGVQENRSDHALEQISASIDGYAYSLGDETTYDAVSKLLQRPWFQRLWVRNSYRRYAT